MGKGELWDELQEIKRSHGDDERIQMVGWKPYEEIPDYIAASDICLLPAYKNQIMMNIVPIKIYEYLAAGKCVIATNLPGLRKEFGDENGVVYIEDQNEVLSSALQLMVNGDLPKKSAEAVRAVSGNGWRDGHEPVRAVIVLYREERRGPSCRHPGQGTVRSGNMIGTSGGQIMGDHSSICKYRRTKCPGARS